jgi:hypothetical protein
MPAVERAHECPHLIPVPNKASLEFGQSDTPKIDLVKDGLDLHTCDSLLGQAFRPVHIARHPIGHLRMATSISAMRRMVSLKAATTLQ